MMDSEGENNGPILPRLPLSPIFTDEEDGDHHEGVVGHLSRFTYSPINQGEGAVDGVIDLSGEEEDGIGEVDGSSTGSDLTTIATGTATNFNFNFNNTVNFNLSPTGSTFLQSNLPSKSRAGSLSSNPFSENQDDRDEGSDDGDASYSPKLSTPIPIPTSTPMVLPTPQKLSTKPKPRPQATTQLNPKPKSQAKAQAHSLPQTKSHPPIPSSKRRRVVLSPDESYSPELEVEPNVGGGSKFSPGSGGEGKKRKKSKKDEKDLALGLGDDGIKANPGAGGKTKTTSKPVTPIKPNKPNKSIKPKNTSKSTKGKSSVTKTKSQGLKSKLNNLKSKTLKDPTASTEPKPKRSYTKRSSTTNDLPTPLKIVPNPKIREQNLLMAKRMAAFGRRRYATAGDTSDVGGVYEDLKGSANDFGLSEGVEGFEEGPLVDEINTGRSLDAVRVMGKGNSGKTSTRLRTIDGRITKFRVDEDGNRIKRKYTKRVEKVDKGDQPRPRGRPKGTKNKRKMSLVSKREEITSAPDRRMNRVRMEAMLDAGEVGGFRMDVG